MPFPFLLTLVQYHYSFYFVSLVKHRKIQCNGHFVGPFWWLASCLFIRVVCVIYGQTSSPEATPCKYLVVGFALLNNKNSVRLIFIRHWPTCNIPACMSRHHQRPSQSLLSASLRRRCPYFSFLGMPAVTFYIEPRALYVQMKLLPRKRKSYSVPYNFKDSEYCCGKLKKK